MPVFLVIATVIFLARSVYTVHPEVGVDARLKWITTIEIAESGSYEALLKEDHHSSRWAINLPVVIAHKVGEISLFNYFLTPLLAYTALFGILILIAGRSISPTLTALFGVLLFYEPTFFRASAQLQPYVFGACYAIAAIWFLNLYIERTKIAYLLLASFFAFCTYGAKETYIFFFPGMFLLLWWRLNFMAMFRFGCILLGWLALETIIFNMISGNLTYGRIEFLFGGRHVNSVSKDYPDGVTFMQMVTGRWRGMHWYDQILCLGVAIYSVYLVLSKKFVTLDNFALSMFMVTIIYAALITFVPLRLVPLTPLQLLLPIYLIVLMPFMVYCFVYAINDLVSMMKSPVQISVLRSIQVFIVVFLVFSIVAESPVKYRHRINRYPDKQAFIWRYQEVYDAIKAGYAVCAYNYFAEKNIKENLTNFLYPPLQRSDLMESRITINDEEHVNVIHLKSSDINHFPGYIRGSKMDFVSGIDECRTRT